MNVTASPSILSARLRRSLWWQAIPWILPALLALSVIVRGAILGGKRLLWADELLAWYPVSRSFGAMLAATTDIINAAPLLFLAIRAVGPSLNGVVSGALQDPRLELRDGTGATLASNDNWRTTNIGGLIDSDQSH